MTRHGLYQSVGTAYPHQFQSYWREQATSGMTTAAVNGWQALCPPDPQTGLVIAVEGLLDAGLARVGEPLLMFCSPDDLYWAKQKSRREWPEVVLPNLDDPSPHQFDSVWQAAREAHRLYFRCSLFVNGNYVKEGKRMDGNAAILGEAVDIWIVHAHTWQQDTEKNAKALGKELWAAFTVSLPGQYDHMRYYAGLWCWARRPKQALAWCFTHDQRTRVGTDGSLCVPETDHWSLAIPKPDGTVQSTPGYDGYAVGIKECRMLEHWDRVADGSAGDAGHDRSAVREYLAFVRASVPFQMPRPGKALPELTAQDVLGHLEAM